MGYGGTTGPTSSEEILKDLIQGFSAKFNIPTVSLDKNTIVEDLCADSLDIVDIVTA